MPGLPRASRHRRRRRDAVERPINGRLYRLTTVVAAVPALAVTFAVSEPSPLPAPAPPAFDANQAYALAEELASAFPDRTPGSAGAAGAADRVAAELALYGYEVERDRFRAAIPGLGRTALENIVATARGRTQRAIIVLAHRDNLGVGPGANANASGTGALLELARVYGQATRAAGGGAVTPTHTIVFVSTDGGAFGGLGGIRLAERPGLRRRTLAAVNLVALAGPRRARVDIAATAARSPSPVLVRTAEERIRARTGREPRRTGILGQLVDLAFPFSLYEHAPFAADGVPALTLTTAGVRPPEPFGDAPERLSARRMGELGASAQALVDSLDQGLELAEGPRSYIYLGSRVAAGWAVQLALLAAGLPFLVGLADLLLRARRGGARLVPALRGLARRVGFWAFAAALFWSFDAAGLWTEGESRPISPHTPAAGDWAVTAVAAYAACVGVAWLVARSRLVPRAGLTPADELAGYGAGLLALTVVAAVAAFSNPYALVFVLPSLHAWLWLPQVPPRVRWLRLGLYLLGMTGPLLLLGSLAIRFGLGFDAPWYLAQLVAVGYVGAVPVLAAAVWLAGAGQVAAVAAGRYGPYPGRAERRAGLIGTVARRLHASSQ